MSDTPIRRTNWAANPQGDARPAAPAPQNRHDPHNKDFLGFSEDEFEAAFRALERQTPSPPVREGSVFKKEPVFEGFGFKVIGGLGTFSRAFRLKALLRSFDGARVKIESVGAGFEFLVGGTRTAGQPPPQDYSRTFAQTFEEEMRSGFVTVIAVTGLVFVAVIGALIYSWVGVKNTGEPIVTKADTLPEKQMAAAETEQPSSDKLIYDRLGSTGDSNNEKIVSREEQPVDNLQAPDASSAAVPAAPASPPQASSTPSETNKELAESPPSAAAAEDVATPAVRTATPPKPVTKPQAQPLRKANVTSTTPSAVPSSGAGFVVQVSSQKSQDSARASFPSLQARFPRVLTGYQPSIKAVTLGVRGTHYRVRVGPLASRDEASALCGRLKAAGGDCVVTPN